MKTQKEIVLEALQGGARLTSTTALVSFGIARLASRISDLKKDGYPIERDMIEVKKRDGTTAVVAEYYLRRSRELF